MERGAFQRRQPRSTSDAVMVSDARMTAGNNSTNTNNTTTNAASDHRRPPHPIREQDQYMPIANVIRIMRRILPPHAKISDDAKETVQECVSEYISFITGEANDRCQREQRKTITAEDVLWAMGKLGFDNYIDPLTSYLNLYRHVESDRTALRGEPFVKRRVDYASPVRVLPPGYVPVGFNVGQQQFPAGFFDGAVMGGYYGGGSGGGGSSSSSSQVAMAGFDPYGQYK